jgi:hypothetical protein
MKRIINLCLVTVLLAGGACLSAFAQTPAAPEPSLGDYARNVKKDKKTVAKTFDNDNIPMQDNLNVVEGPASQSASAKTPDGVSAETATPTENADGSITSGTKPAPGSHAAKADVDKDKEEITPGESADDRKKVFEKWQDKLGDQQQKVELLNREIDVMQREYKLKVADMYGDAGSRLRNESNWDKQDADYKTKLEEKQKDLTDAKQNMDDMQEDARKSGVPSSVIENAQKSAPSTAPQN